MSSADKLYRLAKSLFPRGRAFRMNDKPPNGVVAITEDGLQIITESGELVILENLDDSNKEILGALVNSLIQSESKAYDDAISIYNSVFPDNDAFAIDDAERWERILGMITNPAVILSDRILAIARRIAFPGTVAPRQSPEYLEAELRKAGFDVHVYRNKFSDGMGGYITKTPEQINPTGGTATNFHSTLRSHGTRNHNNFYRDIIANSVDAVRDSQFIIGSNYRSTFFIAGSTVDTFASIDKNRKAEFRQMVLQIKPTQEVGFLFLNYV